MMDKDVNWRHLRFSLDADYVEDLEAPILANLIRKHKGFFWCEPYCYIIEGKVKNYIKRFPDWRNKLKISMDSVKGLQRRNELKKYKKLPLFFKSLYK